jgi:hypothetical protein
MQMCQASPLIQSLAYSLVSSYFWFGRVSLAEYLLILRVYSHLVAVVDSYWSPEVPSSLLGVKTRPLGMVSVVFSPLCFYRMWLRTGSTWTKCGFKTMLLLLFLIWFVITYSYSDVWELLMNYCNKCCVMLNHYDLGCSQFGLKSLVISWTTGVIWAQLWEFDRFGDCF